MYRTSRSVITALLILIVVAFSIGTSWADPGQGKGSDNAPAHGRDDKDDKDDQDAPEEEDAPEEASEEESSSHQGSEDESSGAGSASDQESDQESDEERSERPSRSDSAQRTGSGNGSSAEQADVVDVSFSASPASLSIGETSILTVVASNPGTDQVSSVGVLVELPSYLDVVGSDPAAPASGDLVSLDLGPLAPGETSEGRVTVVASSAPAGAQEPVRFAVSIDDRVVRHQLYVEVSPGGAGGLSLTQSSPLLVQVGETSAFSALVANQTQAPLEDVVVITEIAPEFDVVGVAAIAEADAVQLGGSPSREDIVWIFERLAPGEEVQLSWSARAVAPGDLEARNDVDATIGGEPAASSSQNTYLGYVLGVRTEGGREIAPVVEQRTVTKMVPVTVEVAASTGGVLPVTGASPGALVMTGLFLIALGAVLVSGSRASVSPRRALALTVVALMLTGAACVSDSGDSADTASEAPAPAASPTPAPDDRSPKEKDQVLGLRLDRKAPEGGAPLPTEGSDGSTAEDAATTTEVVFEEVTSVVSVVVPPEDLPADSMQTRGGDNTIFLEWAEGGVVTQTSGRILTPEMTQELLVSLQTAGDDLTSTVTLANLSEDRRLVVRGRLVLEIVAGSGRSSTLSSDHIDVVLEPGATTAADLSFSLPPGTYSLMGGFVTD